MQNLHLEGSAQFVSDIHTPHNKLEIISSIDYNFAKLYCNIEDV